jgi:hypothetical protein
VLGHPVVGAVLGLFAEFIELDLARVVVDDLLDQPPVLVVEEHPHVLEHAVRR